MTVEETATSESSTGTEEKSYLDATPAESSTAEDAKPAESSTEDKGAEKPAEPATPLEVVNKAMADMQTEESPPSKPGEADQKPEAKTEAEGDDEKPPPFHEHPRWKQVTAENQQLKEQVQEYEKGEVAQRAQNYEQLNTHLQAQNLNADDFNNGLAIMSAMKNDPAKALEMIQPYYNELVRMNGHILPPDLQDKVENGVIDEDTARAMSKDRAQNQLLQQQLERQRLATQHQSEESQKRDQQTAMEQHVQSLKDAVISWETEWSKDPDYQKLQPFVTDRFARAAQATPPKTPEEAVKLAQEVKDAVAKEMAGMLVKKEPITNLDSSGKNLNSGHKPAPKSGLDVVSQALAG